MRRRLLKDSAVYISGSIIVQLMGFLGLVLLMKFLPVETYGKYTYIIEFISIFAFFSDGGFTQLIVKESSQNPDDTKSIYAKAQSAQILISSAMLLMIIILAFPTNTFEDFFYLSIYGLSVVISAFFAPMLAVLVAQGRKELIFWKDVSLSIVKLICIVFGILYKAPVIYFLSLGFLNCLVLFCLFLYTRYKEKYSYFFSSRTDLRGSVGFIRQGAIFTVLMAANVVYNKIDIIMLEKMKGSIEVGYYSGATRFIYPFMFISNAFMTAIFPSLAKYSNNKLKFDSIQYLALYCLGAVGVILSSGLFLSSDLIFNIFFADKYDASAPVFRILVWFLAIVFIYGSITNNLIAKGKVKFLVYLNIAMIFMNVALNFFLIPAMGAKGAAIATITCEVIILLSAVWYWRNVR